MSNILPFAAKYFIRYITFLVVLVAPINTLSAETTLGPKFFIADELGEACTKDAQGKERDEDEVWMALHNLTQYHQKYVDKLTTSTALTAKHDKYSANWKPILFNSYAAAASNDTVLARIIIDGLTNMATAQIYLNEKGLMTWKQALDTRCYEKGTDAPCPSHTPRFVTRMYANLFISAAVLQSFMTDDDREAILPWFKAAYKKFMLPPLKNNNSDGIYDFANLGFAQLAYAALTNNKGLARRELSTRRRDLTRRIQTSGYIRNNSFLNSASLFFVHLILLCCLVGCFASCWVGSLCLVLCLAMGCCCHCVFVLLAAHAWRVCCVAVLFSRLLGGSLSERFHVFGEKRVWYSKLRSFCGFSSII